MLKDLDQRQNENNVSSGHHVPVQPQPSSIKLVAITLAIVIVINVLGLFIWQLYQENETLKNSAFERVPGQNQTEVNLPSEKVKEEHLTNVTNIKENNQPAAPLQQLSSELNVQPNQALTEASKTSASSTTVIEQTSVNLSQSTEKLPVVKREVNDAQSKEILSSQQTTNTALITEQKSSAEQEVEQPKLVISRKSLTAEELITQKITIAEQALNRNDLEKAEQLFEEVLVLDPRHKGARRQLAALWFGRQSYQPAINLLSQGLKLFQNDADFRLMIARIYLSQGQEASAVNVLEKSPKVQDVEYQSLLAIHAQNLSRFSVAKTAYTILTELEPKIGRWWLGLAVSLDSNSEFSAAVEAYNHALSTPNFSVNAEQFVRQRLQALGD